MDVQALDIPDVKLVLPTKHVDNRGFFVETYNKQRFEGAGIVGDFVQDNQSLSKGEGTLRGLHFQIPPFAQDKLVRVVRGSIFDVAVDLRRGSATFGQHVSAVLSAENGYQLWIPKGFAHGFCTLESMTEVLYKVTDYYNVDCDRGLAWDDPAIGIHWPVAKERAIVSERDSKHPRLADLTYAFE